MRVRVRVELGGGETEAKSANGQVIRLGRDPSCEVAIDPDAFPTVSGIHARIEQGGGEMMLVPLSKTNKTVLNGSAIEAPSPIQAGDRVRLGFKGPSIQFLALDAGSAPTPAAVRRPQPPTTSEPASQDDLGSRTMQADARHIGMLRGTGRTGRFVIGAGGVIGRDAAEVQFPLDHPHVSRHHASLAEDNGKIILVDLGSSNGTFLNGRKLNRPTVLTIGDRIEIGPFSLQFDGTGLASRSRSNNIELTARGVKRVVTDRASSQPLALLDDINLVIRPREFVCLLGPSGSGKSTLLTILSGRNPPTAGKVGVNGENLYTDFEALKQDIAVVPQKDILHDSLAVEAALRYTAQLRLPSDLSADEVEASVTDILGVVGLTKRKATLIRHLSGGQVKRASLANELVSRPSLLFLDEVTSGLDEQTDREVMELFREVADGGKTVVCITHNLANVEATCHLVVILTEGGRLAFFGKPDEAKQYFGIPRLGEVYKTLAQQPPEAWANKYRSSPFYQRYIAQRMPMESTADKSKTATAGTRRAGRKVSVLRQASVLTRRYISIWRGDRSAMLAMLGQSLLVAMMLGLVFGKLDDIAKPPERVMRTVNLFLLLAISCFWFGCNTAAKELVKERVIFLRERDFNLRIEGYFLSKFLVLTVIGLIQASVLFGIVELWCQPPGSMLAQWLTLAGLVTTGTMVGLLISALARSEEVATALVPIAVIPQIVLAGVIAPLSGLALWLARGLVTVYWGRQALESLIPESDMKWIQRDPESWFGPMVIVLLHAVLTATATVFVLLRSSGKGKTS